LLALLKIYKNAVFNQDCFFNNQIISMLNEKSSQGLQVK